MWRFGGWIVWMFWWMMGLGVECGLEDGGFFWDFGRESTSGLDLTTSGLWFVCAAWSAWRARKKSLPPSFPRPIGTYAIKAHRRTPETQDPDIFSDLEPEP
jgi:hypothetical protein